MTAVTSPGGEAASQDDPFPAGKVGSVALLGQDFPGLRPAFAVEPGAVVAAGDLLFSDRRRPEIRHVAPVAGRVRELARGARRSLEALVIDIGGEDARTFDTTDVATREGLIGLMLESGLWPALRARPFGHIADPAGQADALFITAIDTHPGAPDPAMIIGACRDAFLRGAGLVCRLTSGPTWLCAASGADIPQVDGAQRADFSTTHPAGLPGGHIHKLFPVTHSRTVWQIGYQDVIALGCLAQTGRIQGERVVSLAGPAVRAPECVRVPMGAFLHDLMDDRVVGRPRILSGSRIDGRPDHFLGRYHLQATALHHDAPPAEPADLRARLSRFLSRRPDALVPNGAHEAAAPAGILPIPFLRAISIGDIETAAKLGALELVEEDMALLSKIDGVDYGALLRRTLDELEAVS